MKQAILKAEKGLLEVSIETTSKTLKTIQITGDFFFHPESALEALEAELEDTPLDIKLIREKITNFYKNNNITTPGVTIDDWETVIKKALKK
ncbi:MAG: lipoate protein ligase C-terminal domain-containing protein [Asgard group archaeon]|nr:lipoate protein ligase C-terminal domain-containing protein [Asgard group archaeon]